MTEDTTDAPDEEPPGDTPDETYVHDPAAFREDTTGEKRSSGSGSPSGGQSRQPRNEPREADPDGEFDWRGWVLVATVAVAFLVVPGALYALPTARGAVAALGLSLRDTYLVLPLVPAFLLGAVAVWSAIRSRTR